ncbi:MAG: hypothetical protein K2J47_08690 [Ruminococcus sp.]|nr:hypothetical protein [Ruminococcus sp.]
MKDYKEISENVLKRRDEYLKIQKHRKSIVVKTTSSVLGIATAACLSIAIYNNSIIQEIKPDPNRSPYDLTEHTEMTSEINTESVEATYTTAATSIKDFSVETSTETAQTSDTSETYSQTTKSSDSTAISNTTTQVFYDSELSTSTDFTATDISEGSVPTITTVNMVTTVHRPKTTIMPPENTTTRRTTTKVPMTETTQPDNTTAKPDTTNVPCTVVNTTTAVFQTYTTCVYTTTISAPMASSETFDGAAEGNMSTTTTTTTETVTTTDIFNTSTVEEFINTTATYFTYFTTTATPYFSYDYDSEINPTTYTTIVY